MKSTEPADTILARFHGHVKQTPSSTDESINDERVNPTEKVTTDINRCRCLADVYLEALWDKQTNKLFPIILKAIALEQIQ